MVAQNDHRSDSETKAESKRTSEKRVAANRRNAQKSTGPRTTDGKAASRMNAVRHGGRCSTLELLPGEDAALFDQLRKSILQSLRPADAAEDVLVDQYVSVSWKLRRLGDVEAAMNAQASRCESTEKRRARMVSFGLPASLAERFTKEPVESVKSIGELLLAELRKGNGPRLQLIAVEERLRRMLGRTIRELKELRLLKRMMRQEETEAPAATPADQGMSPKEDAAVEAPEVIVADPAPAVRDAHETISGKSPAADVSPEGAGMSQEVGRCPVLTNEPNEGGKME